MMLRRKAKREDSGANALEINTSTIKSSPPPPLLASYNNVNNNNSNNNNKSPLTPGLVSDENQSTTSGHHKTDSSDVEFITPNSQYHQYPFSYSPTVANSGGLHKGNLNEKFGMDNVNREGQHHHQYLQQQQHQQQGGGNWATHDSAFQTPSSTASTTILNNKRPLIPPRQNSASATNIDMSRRAATSPASSSSSSHQLKGQYFYQQDAASPTEMMLKPTQQHQLHSNVQSGTTPQIGRSQSTFNFFLSKAKASFSSSSSQNPSSSQDSPLNTSNSLASLHSAGHSPYEEFMNGTPSSPTSIRITHADAHGTPRPPPPPRPSFGDEIAVTSSPTKRSFFGGNRERKASTQSVGKGNSGGLFATSSTSDKGNWGSQSGSNKLIQPHSPLAREERSEVSTFAYGQFSKSQSDLHVRTKREFPSPVKGSTALPPPPPPPPLPASSSKFSYKPKVGDVNMLQSPTSTLGFSRSVDDLSRSSSPDVRQRSPAQSPGQERDARWGDHIDTMQNNCRQIPESASRDVSPMEKIGKNENPFASVPAYQTNATLRNTAWPQDSSTSYNQSMVVTPLPLSSGNSSKRPASSPRDQTFPKSSPQYPPNAAQLSDSPARQLPPGVTYEGFLNRNANISLSFKQLVDSKGREKEISKGWKPYRVSLKDGKLYFSKPNGIHGDQIKALFPAGIVNGNEGGSSQYARDLGINMDDIQKSKLSTQDLLAATSRGSLDQPPSGRVPARRQHQALSAITDHEQEGEAKVMAKTRSWEREGKHKDLILSESAADPVVWQDRIEGGTLEALAHEYIFASQSDETLNSDQTAEEEAGRLIYCLLIVASGSGQGLQHLMVEMSKWVEFAMNLSKEDGMIGGSQEKRTLFYKGLQMRVSILLDCDVLNMAVSRGEMLKIIESIISRAWTNDKASAEKQLAKILAQGMIENAPDWLGKGDDQTDYIRWTSALRPSALLNLEPAELARQIHLFTLNQLNSLKIPANSILRLLHPKVISAMLHQFSYDWSRPHFLTRLILDQILQSSGSLEGGSLHGAKLRASLLRHWIAVASYLIKLDNVGAWLSICVALCSRSVSRLATSWKFVASNDRALVGTIWAPVLIQMGWSEMIGTSFTTIHSYLGAASSIKFSMNPRHQPSNDFSTSNLISSCPYLGNALACIASIDNGGISISRAKNLAKEIRATTKEWQSKQRQFIASKQPTNTNENLELQRALQSLCILNERTISTTTFDPIPLLAQSIQLEPVTLGKVDHTRKPQLSKSMTACAQSPLLFPESLPTLSIVNREEQVKLIAEAYAGSDTGEMRKSPIRSTLNPFNQLNQDMISNSHQRWTSKSQPTQLGKGVAYSQIIEWNPTLQQQEQDENLIKVGSDLILINLGEENSGLPFTPLLAKRFSQEMGQKSRPVSQVSKRSSMPASNRSSLIDMPQISLHVLVKSGSLDRLIDIIVMGLQHINIDATDESSERKRSHLIFDLDAYRKTFLATYRSFCSSVNLFDHLRKRFSAAVNGAIELSLPLQHRSSFPTWSQLESAANQIPNIDWDIVSKIRSGIIEFLSSWISTFPQDFAETDQLYKGILLWIQDMSKAPAIEGDFEWEKMMTSLVVLQERVQLAVMTCCIKQGEKKMVRRSIKRSSTSQGDISNVTQNSKHGEKLNDQEAILNFDEASPVELVDYLESVAKVFFEKIEERDFLMACELFQSRNNDSMAWFIAKNSTSALASQHRDEIPQVNNMYKLLELIRWPRDGSTLSLRLATSIRDACAAQNLLRGWIAIQIIEGDIGLIKREARIEKLLDAVWICRARMMNSRMEEGANKMLASNVFREPTIASFVECLIVGSLNSSESRLFTRAWLGVAVKRKGNCDNLYSLVPSSSSIEEYREATTSISTPDIGWILKILAEVSTRFAYESGVAEGGGGGGNNNGMIAYDQYRTMWAVIESSIGFFPKNSEKANTVNSDLVELAGSRLSSMQNALRNVTWERRAFQENARLESQSAPPMSNLSTMQIMRNGKPLTDMLSLQQDKHRRDKGALKILEYHQQQKRSREALFAAQANQNGGMVNSSSIVFPSPLQFNQSGITVGLQANQQGRGGTSQGQSLSNLSSVEKRTKRMTALFRGAVRPMGGLMGSNTSSGEKNSNMITPEQRVYSHSVAELLTMTPSTKPSLIVNCGSSRVCIWRNNQRSFIFNLSLVEGGHYLLQANNHSEMINWCKAIEDAGKNFALPNVTFSSSEASRNKGGKKGNALSIPFYGTDVATLIELEKRPIPLGLLRMLEEVEARGLREQGIYRISGAKNAIEGLKQTLSKQPAESIDLAHGEYSDIHTIAGAIKQWFRDLPEPVVPYNFYHRLIEAEQIEKEEDRLYAIRDLVWEFPKAHFDLLKRTSQHLALVCDEGKYNLMAPHNIGLVFGTSLLNPPPGPNSVAESFGNIGKAAHIVKIIITMHEWLFEPEPEPENGVEIEGEGEGEGENEGEEEIEGGEEQEADVDLNISNIAVEQSEYKAAAAPAIALKGEEKGIIESEAKLKLEEEDRSHMPSSSSSQATLMPLPSQTSRENLVNRGEEGIPTITIQEDSVDKSNQRNKRSTSSSRVAVVEESNNLGAAKRDRAIVESIYLDATDAIAVLQDPFQIVDDDEEE